MGEVIKKVLVNEDSLYNIADAIREKNGTEETYKPAEMGNAILNIISGGNVDGIDAVKFIDIDITVDASTDTMVKYTIEDLELLGVQNPTNTFTALTDQMYMCAVTPKSYSAEPSGQFSNVFGDSFTFMVGNTNYAKGYTHFKCIGNSSFSNQSTYGIYSPQLNAKSINDGKIIGSLTVEVRHHPVSGFEVVAGTYNIQVFHLTNFSGGIS